MTSAVRPARGTRPSNRRELIVSAATDLFAGNGFENVSMSEVADAVAVGPSALYRHVSGKDQLLTEVIDRLLDRLAESLDRQPTDTGAEDVLRRIIGFAAGNTQAGVLWFREARHLSPDLYAAVRSRIGRLWEQLAGTLSGAADVGADSARLRASAVMAVLLSPSFRRVELPGPQFEQLLADLAQRVITVQVPTTPAGSVSPRPTGLGRVVKREVILDAAVKLFAERTYDSTSMEDIAASVGLATSSVYNHFSGKGEILSTALHRANGYLQLRLADTLAYATDERSALRQSVEDYCGFAVRHPQVLDVLITETRSLSDEEAAGIVQAQRDYVAELEHLYRRVYPEVDEAWARSTVQAALMVINDLARHPELPGGGRGTAIAAAFARGAFGI